MRIPFTPPQLARAVWSYLTAASRAVSVTHVDGVALSAHASGSVPTDVLKWAGVAVNPPSIAGSPVVDVWSWRGVNVPAPNTAGEPLIDVNRWLGTQVVTPATAGIPSVSAIKRIDTYQGTINVAGSFSGNKDVTITSVTPGKSMLVTAFGASASGNPQNSASIAQVDSANLTWLYASVVSATVMRFNSVVNADLAVAHNIAYAFTVVEFF